jgi:hypothetical protein
VFATWVARRWVGLCAVVVVVVVGASGCSLKHAAVGTRCRLAGDYAQDGTYVLRCQRGRWVRSQTTASADAAVAAWLANAGPPPPPPPPDPDTARLLDAVNQVYGATAWATEIHGTPWSVTDGFDGGDQQGQTDCSWRSEGNRNTRIDVSVHVLRSVVENADQTELFDVVAHEGGHVIACHRWPEDDAPPGWPAATSGAPSAESFADCLALNVRPSYDDSYYGCPGPDDPAFAAAIANH